MARHGSLSSVIGHMYNLPLGPELKAKWDAIPSDTDILITHGPPLGIFDKNINGFECGCGDLLQAVKERVRPRLHIFGHIHEGYGEFIRQYHKLCDIAIKTSCGSDFFIFEHMHLFGEYFDHYHYDDY